MLGGYRGNPYGMGAANRRGPLISPGAPPIVNRSIVPHGGAGIVPSSAGNYAGVPVPYSGSRAIVPSYTGSRSVVPAYNGSTAIAPYTPPAGPNYAGVPVGDAYSPYGGSRAIVPFDGGATGASGAGGRASYKRRGPRMGGFGGKTSASSMTRDIVPYNSVGKFAKHAGNIGAGIGGLMALGAVGKTYDRLRHGEYGGAALSAGMGAAYGYGAYYSAMNKQAMSNHFDTAAKFVGKKGSAGFSNIKGTKWGGAIAKFFS